MWRSVALDWIILLVAGLAAGFLATLLGIGGGVLMVPLLHYGFGRTFPEATAISLAAMILPSLNGVRLHAKRGALDLRLGGILAASGLFGVLAGAWLQPRLATDALKLLFSFVMAFAGWRLWVQITIPRVAPAHPAGIAGIGLGAGLISRLVGIGGGLVTGPALSLMGIPIHVAVASGLVAVFTNAVVATGVQAATGTIDWMAAGLLALGALAAGPLGTRTAHALSAKRLGRVFAVALWLAAVGITVQVLKPWTW